MTGLLPRRRTSGQGRPAVPAGPWTEERLARLAEDAARLTPDVSGPVATVRVDGPATRIDLDLVVRYGAHLPTVAEAVRRRVTARIQAHAGRVVESVTVSVVDVLLPPEPPGPAGWDDDAREGDVDGRPAAGG